MIERIKEKIAGIVINYNLKKLPRKTQRSFAGFFKKSFTFLVIMPEDHDDFNKSLVILDFLEENKKHPTILTFDYKLSLIPQKYRYRIIDITINDLNQIDLPNKNFTGKIKDMKYNAVIDLNRKENLFWSYIANLVNADIKIGFTKNKSDLFYNLQISNYSGDPLASYKNFIKCIEMF